jgi:phosphatidylglycerol:prolipoprotein diacylglycerol transferase
MHPVVATVPLLGRELTVGSYGVLLAAAILAGSFLALRASVRAGLDAGAVIAATAMTVGGAFTGAFLLHGALALLRGLPAGEAVLRGGMVFFGGAGGGAAALLLGCRFLRLPFGALADLWVPAVAVAHAVGRVGCFLAGCCFGRPWEGALAVVFTHPLAPAAVARVGRHPVQLYEAAMLLALAAGFALRPAGEVGSGRRALLYFALYAAGRLALEGLRDASERAPLLWGVLSPSQVIAVGLVVVCGGALAAGARRTREGHDLMFDSRPRISDI